MPLAALLILSPDNSIPDCHLGREAQAWFLKQIQGIDPALSEALHSPSDVKPYTVSDLFALPDQDPSEPRFALRLTALSADLEELVATRLLPKPPHRVKLWYGSFRVESVILDSREHPWTGSLGYGGLVQAARERNRAAPRLEFITPTGFRSDGMDIPLPLPHLIFRGCWQKWNAFAPEEMRMDESVLEFIKDCVWVEELRDLNTTRLTFAEGKRGGAIGFTGQVGLSLRRTDKAARWANDWDGYARKFRTLALYAFYCGTGHHTTIGMGQTYPHLEG